jgi:hypothetical protein
LAHLHVLLPLKSVLMQNIKLIRRSSNYVKEGFRGREWLLSEVTRVVVDPSIEGARRRSARNSKCSHNSTTVPLRVVSKHVLLVSYEEVWARLGAKMEWRSARLEVVKFERLWKNMFIGLR